MKVGVYLSWVYLWGLKVFVGDWLSEFGFDLVLRGQLGTDVG